VVLLARQQPEPEARVVVVDGGIECGEAAVVETPALRMREDRRDRRRARPLVRRSIRLKRIDADFAWQVQVPTGVGPDRLDVTVVAARFATEQIVAALRGG